MRVRFDRCTFDSECRELRRDGVLAALSPKACALLERLLRSRPRLLRKSELHKALWPDTYVSDGTLTSVVAELRRAIGDTGEPPLIRTSYGLGYAFVAAVAVLKEVDGGAASVRLVWGARQFVLAPGEHLVGRDHDCSVRLQDRSVSRRHAAIEALASEVRVRDIGSHNGTRVNGVPITSPYALRDRDRLLFGSAELIVRIGDDTPSSTLDIAT
jgi:DNA-binding winged helix-turn-helix (wHTH) protein